MKCKIWLRKLNEGVRSTILSEVQPPQRLAHREEWLEITDIRANMSA